MTNNCNTLSVTVTHLRQISAYIYKILSLICFFKKLNMMKIYYERLEEVFEVNIQLLMESRICTTNFVNIDPIVLKLCCVE